jgi:ATP-dependent RNA helicase TDRD9
VPQFILDDAIAKGQTCNIIISQPRKIAAITVARRVASERQCNLGQLVGYQVGLDKKRDEDYKGNRLMFCTTGVILQKMIQEKSMVNYTHVILDEIHEREIDMDLLITVVREFMIHNSGATKLILMSATLQAEIFVNYLTFQLPDITIPPSIVKHKAERNHLIKKLFLDDFHNLQFQDDLVDYMKPGITAKLYQVAKEIVIDRLRQCQKSILVFLPGICEIDAMHAMLKDVEELADTCLICVLHSSLSMADQKVAFMPSTKPKIVLSTNIAESSVTINDVSCVIDFCLTKLVTINQNSTMSSLQLEWAAKDSLEQRAGRTGRTCDGVVYRLIRRSFYNDRLNKFTVPEMERSPLETVVLRIKMLDIESPVVLLAKSLSPPEPSAISRAALTLKELGGLERVTDDGDFIHNDGKLTYVGRIMAALPLDVRVSKLIILGYVFSVLDEAIIIAAGLNNKSIFRNNFHQKLDDYTHKLSWSDGSCCDFIAILNAYKLWKFMSEQGHFSDWKVEQKWCNQYNLERKSLHEMRELIREVKKRLAELSMESLAGQLLVTWEEKEKPLVLKICIAGAFIPNFFIAGESTESLEQDIHKQLGNKSPYNTIYFRNMDKKYMGEVYEEQIKQKIVDAGICSSTKNMKVSFDQGSTKFFVQFIGNDTMVDSDVCNIADNYDSGKSLFSGKISAEVYKAAKLRKLGYRLSLDVMSSEETEAHAMKCGLMVENNGFVERNKNFTKLPELCVLPLTSTESLIGFITHIDHCGKFFIQPTDENCKKVLEYLQEKLAEENLENVEEVDGLEWNQLVIVKHAGVLNRAKIVGVKSRTQVARCFMFDFGTTIEVLIADVYKVTEDIEEYFDIPERCFEASLSEIMPALKCPRGKWTAAAIDEFKKLALNREAKVEVYSVIEDIVSAKLWIGGICINKALIDAEYAKECEESFPRKHNHEIRVKVQNSSGVRYGPKEEFAEHTNKMRPIAVEPPPKSKCNLKFSVSGPISPLETTLSRVIIDFKCADINIDPNSANSVLLVDDPSNAYGRLIVSAHVTKNKNGIVLHETTLMPDIPGLPLLLAMIFAPDVIFRRNDDKTKYNNMQFGLGCYKQNAEPYFREHDCILPVNFKLEGRDFSDVNYLRFLMSHLLTTEPNEQLSSLSDEQKSDLLLRVKNQLLKVLSKNLQPVALSYATPTENGDWSTENQTDAKVWQDVFIGGGTYHRKKNNF